MLNVRKKSRKMWRTLQKQDRGAKQREKTTPIQGANSSVQSVEISHTSIQGAKLIPRCEIPCSKCESSKCNFRTPLFKVRKFSHHAKHPPGTRVEFRTPQAKFRTVRNKVRNWVRNAKQGANSLVQSMEISHDAIQGAKFPVQGAKISHGKILSCKNFKLTFKLKFYPRNCA